jgi:histidinol-phosphatase (PHP family)
VRELIDCHIHTERCGHAVGVVDDYAKAALSRGLSGIVMTEHLPMPEGMDPDHEVSMPMCDLEDYLVEVDFARNRYPELEIVTGVEADFLPGRLDEVRDILSAATNRADGATFVLGSVHVLGSWTFDDPNNVASWESRDIDEVWNSYFTTWNEACRSGLFQVMAHPDLVKKFGHRPSSDVSELHREAARAAAESGVLIEVSTAGLRKPVGELYPGPDLLSAFARAGVGATVGSDAHAPGEVGYGIEIAYAALRGAGYEAVHFPDGEGGWRAIEL